MRVIMTNKKTVVKLQGELDMEKDQRLFPEAALVITIEMLVRSMLLHGPSLLERASARWSSLVLGHILEFR
jgi:hypothetical protein